MVSQTDIDQLRTYFLGKTGDNVIQGHIKPSAAEEFDLGTADKPFRTIYVHEIVADIGGGGGGDGGDADKVDGYDANATPTASTLLPLNGSAVFPDGVIPNALLKDGSRSLEGNLTVVGGATIDGVDVGSHTHSGSGSNGPKIDHLNLLNNDADVHPQYAQNAQNEIITGNWIFTDVIDRSKGWEFKPAEYLFQAVPHSMKFTASASKAEIAVGPSGEIIIYDDSSNTYLTVGLSNNVIGLTGTDATYRMYVGHATPASAPFRVTKEGNVEVDGRITVGSGDDVAILAADDEDDYRLWVGDDDPAAAPFRVTMTGVVTMNNASIIGSIRSNNYVAQEAGFYLDSSGFAEMANVRIRGLASGVAFVNDIIGVVAGQQIITDGTVLALDLADDEDTITVRHPSFEVGDILQIKPDDLRNEWMQVVSGPVSVDDVFEYEVDRNLNGDGPFEFLAGEFILRKGQAGEDPEAYSMGEPDQAFGEDQFAGSGATFKGGYLKLEGSRLYGPYFGVSRRIGPNYSQISDVIRIGLLRDFLSVTEDEYGIAIGDVNRSFVYTYRSGLRLMTGAGKTIVDDLGVSTSDLILTGGDAPLYENGKLKFYLDVANHKLRARFQDGAYRSDTIVANL